MTMRIKVFTLLEVLVALAILAGAVTATMYAMTASARRVQRAERFRVETHRLANAIEFFMLYPPGASNDDKFFPYEEMRAICTYGDVELPEGIEAVFGELRLVRMTVEITTSANAPVAELALDRIVEADKL